jgi:subtilisin family serine protease
MLDMKGREYTILELPEPRQQRHVVVSPGLLGAVRSGTGGARSKGTGAGTAAGAGHDGRGRAKAMLSTRKLSPRDWLDVARDPRRVGAPVMPLRLIHPVRSARRKGGAAKAASGGAAWGITAIGAEESSFDGLDVCVAVLDTGIDPKHPAFNDAKLQRKMVIRDFTGEGPQDDVGHGTHCAATIFGRDVGKRIGVARRVERVLIGKVLSSSGGSSKNLFEALQWALNSGAQVISLSLGFDYPGMVEALHTEEGMPIDLATAHGLHAFQANLRLWDRTMDLLRVDGGEWDAVVVAAAGNESRADRSPPYRIPASLPASGAGVVSVGAVGREGGRYMVAPFSNSLPLVCAPGVGIESAKAGSKGLTSLSGTSMACPHVAGAAALWWQSLKQTKGFANGGLVAAALSSSANVSGFAKGVTLDERGAGIVTCPP